MMERGTGRGRRQGAPFSQFPQNWDLAGCWGLSLGVHDEKSGKAWVAFLGPASDKSHTAVQQNKLSAPGCPSWPDRHSDNRPWLPSSLTSELQQGRRQGLAAGRGEMMNRCGGRRGRMCWEGRGPSGLLAAALLPGDRGGC